MKIIVLSVLASSALSSAFANSHKPQATVTPNDSSHEEHHGGVVPPASNADEGMAKEPGKDSDKEMVQPKATKKPSNLPGEPKKK